MYSLPDGIDANMPKTMHHHHLKQVGISSEITSYFLQSQI
uniref:Uncharacterized protein n=1 Tax=Setaria italica TaxID=4555 RepID=K3XUH7_SETIT